MKHAEPSVNRVLKDRLGHYARPEGRDEPFRARAFAEPALQRTDKTGSATTRPLKGSSWGGHRERPDIAWSGLQR